MTQSTSFVGITSNAAQALLFFSLFFASFNTNDAFISGSLSSKQRSSTLIFSKRKLLPVTSNTLFNIQQTRHNLSLKVETCHFYKSKHSRDENPKENNDSDDNNDNNSPLPSWYLPSNQNESKARRERLVKTYEEMQQFVHGSDLVNLRLDIANFEENLKWALATDDIQRIVDLKNAIEHAQEKDPEYVYSKMLHKIHDVQKMNVSKKYKLLPRYIEDALSARQYIPRLNMEGLWIGNFGSDGTGLINVTYTGDTLLATKVTGECSSKRGEVLFKSDLFPLNGEGKDLDPIPLTGSAAKKFGTQNLERYLGEGRVSSNGSGNDTFTEGQLIMFDGYFSFLYLPSKKHVFFSRPGPELVLELMQSVIVDEKDEVESMKDHLERCFENDAYEAKKESKPWDFTKAVSKDNDEYHQWLPRSAAKADIAFSFWSFHKWMNYIDTALRSSSKSEED